MRKTFCPATFFNNFGLQVSLSRVLIDISEAQEVLINGDIYRLVKLKLYFARYIFVE